ncbi:hypothetical protein [Cellulosimicrobium sp. CUA-896]|uniref:hypothetical protein n=1 Tax=Cellulosimicrobium sp. CUA-896 TaxID=1517881 RepID=UPI000960E96F|nr:hypothetical protein [Cellulosimicrobium sp. CUA-896]OLT45987.1 hypothetical protein BJF88_05410 [Cellulosimicrobium sp. CUA-896]
MQDAVEARLGTLDPGARATVELAAVIGDVVDVDLLVATGRVMPEEALAHLDAALDAHLLEPVDGTPTRVRFRHAIAREVVLGAMSSSRRTELHLHVACALEARGGRGAAHVAQVAHHFEAAHILGHRVEAVRYLRLAAALAADGLAHDEAADLYERAAAIEDDPADADDAVLLAARERLLTGALVRSRRLAEPIAADVTSPHRLRAAVQYEDANWRSNLVGGRSVALLQGALEAPGDHDEELQVRALAGLARALAFDCKDAQGRSLADRAVARAREHGGDDLLLDVLVAALVQGNSVDDADLKLACAAEVTEVCLRTGDLWRLGPAASYRTLLGYQRGDKALVRSGRDDLRLVAEGTHQPYFAYLGGCVDFSRHLAAGRLDRAAQTSETLLEIGAAVELDEDVGPDGQYGVQQFVLRREAGGLDDVRGLVSEDEDLGERWVPGLLALYVELGMHDAARRALRWLLEPGAIDSSPGARVGVLTIVADAAVALRDEDAAGRVRAAIAPYTGLNLMFGSLVTAMGSADRYLGSSTRCCPRATGRRTSPGPRRWTGTWVRTCTSRTRSRRTRRPTVRPERAAATSALSSPRRGVSRRRSARGACCACSTRSRGRGRGVPTA